MIGRRLPDGVFGSALAWRDAEPGDYMRVTYEGSGAVDWHLRDPSGGYGRITGASHTITEHDDGTITISPSVVMPGGWHGWLERGVWRSV